MHFVILPLRVKVIVFRIEEHHIQYVCHKYIVYTAHAVDDANEQVIIGSRFHLAAKLE